MSASPTELARSILAHCRELGFALAGVTRAAPSARLDELRQWLAAGKHGSMEWLARDPEMRADPARVLEGVRSIIMVADVYALGPPDPDHTPAPAGRIARYARGRDYHDVIKRRLHALSDALRAHHPADSFRAFVDTAPVAEREHALRAGLGWIGKHTLLINPTLGSWTLLGGVLTTLDLHPPPEQAAHADHCGTCTRCIDACPTSAITPYSVDARACISYLTIEHRGHIPDDLHQPIGDNVFGCDICQDVCPHNRPRSFPLAPLNDYAPTRAALPLLDILNWTDESRRAALAGSAARRANLQMWRRNALIAAGNALATAPDAALLERVRAAAVDPSETDLIRGTAQAVLARLSEGPLSPSAPPPSRRSDQPQAS
ncbi:MAG: tRNA epoxyqueuosine(34) reductase QueG [Planctomycetota bacterium]|nr:tRNA epoxyqueuosine(34) reductase QueG [Planctomycetota bacterium]